MDPFFTYVSIGALVILIIILTVIGVVMTQVQAAAPFPSMQNTCPDYWDVSSNPQYCGVPISGNKNRGYILTNNDGGNTKIDPSKAENIGMCSVAGFGCKSSGDTYLKSNNDANVTSNYHYLHLNNNVSGWGALYPGTSERCSQKKWASTMNITWDGVTNYNGC